MADKETAPAAGAKEAAPVQAVESPGEETKEHKVTVQIHRDQELTTPAASQVEREKCKASEHVTVIQLQQQHQQPSAAVPIVPLKPAPTPPSKVTMPPPVTTTPVSGTPASRPVVSISTPASAPGALTSSAKPGPASEHSEGYKPIKERSEASQPTKDETDSSQPMRERVGSGINKSEALEMTQSSPNSTQQFASQVVSFSSPIMSTKVIAGQQGGVAVKEKIPLLPPPPPSHKPKARASTRPAGASSELLPPENKLKSKSLPRGLPSDGTAFDTVDSEASMETVAVKVGEENRQREAMMLEEMRLKFEYEELMTLKSELERKKRTERREIAELQEEIATMQTLYQYRTYSVDSSEEDSEGGEVGNILLLTVNCIVLHCTNCTNLGGRHDQGGQDGETQAAQQSGQGEERPGGQEVEAPDSVGRGESCLLEAESQHQNGTRENQETKALAVSRHWLRQTQPHG